MHLIEKPWRVCRSCEAWKWHSIKASHLSHLSRTHLYTPLPAAFVGPARLKGGQAPCHGPARCSQSCWKIASLVAFCVTWFTWSLPHFKVATLLLVALGICPKSSMEFLRGWREDWPGKNDETWTFWRHIGPLGRTVWGLDRIPLKDLKVGEEVDGRVKGRYRSMGWFLVRKVSLERGGIHYFPRGHTYRWAVLQCLHEMIDWGILVPKSVEVEKLGRRGYFRFIYIYIYHLKLSPCLHLTSFLFSHHPPTWIDKLHPRTSAIKNKATRQHEWNQTSKDITQKNKQEANQSTSPPSPKSVYILYIYVRVNTHNIHQLCL